MPPTYELWLTDDSGRRIALLNNTAYFSYSRTVKHIGTCLVGIPYEEYVKMVYPVFVPDRRIDFWRSPEFGYPLRHEQTYLLRKPRIYTRKTDNVQIIALYGRDPKDLLRRRYVIQVPGSSYAYKTDYLDDMMKAIVREQMLYGSCVDADGVQDNTRAFPQYEFTVQGDVSLGPTHTFSFGDRQVLDTLKELVEASIQKYKEDSANNRIYFDVVPVFLEANASQTSAVQGFEFRTYADLRGQDRRNSALIFSKENNNMDSPAYSLDYMDEENSVIVKGAGRGDSRPNATVTDTNRSTLSRWNLCEGLVDASSEPDQSALDDYAYARLREKYPREDISATFLNVPGSEDTPQSLYGIDWDLGDLLPVDYAGKRFDAEVLTVYVAKDDLGKETITGWNNVEEGGGQ